MNKIVKDLVSIITPCYNSSDYISDAIDSGMNQEYEKWEMIIVDDFSSDNSVQIIKKYIEKDSRISHKIVSIVKTTGIPKETVRRKIKKLI